MKSGKPLSSVPVVLLVLAAVFLAPGAARGGGSPFDPWSLWAGPGTALRGANVYQRRVYPELDGTEFMGPGPFGPPYTQEDFDALAAMGANLVDISCPGLFAEKPPYALDPDAQANLDRLLDMARRANLFAVISFRSGPGRMEFSICCYGDDWYDPDVYLDDSVWTDRAAQDAWVAMWRYTAARYRDDPVVVGYDLMVEPNANGVVFDEWDPAAYYAAHEGTLADWNLLFPRIVAAIRESDPATPILVQPMGYGAVNWLPWLETVDDPRTIYAVHQYEPFVYTHQDPPLDLTYPGVFDTDGDGVSETVDRGWLDRLLGTVDRFMAEHGVRCAVNEMGAKRWEPGVDRFLADEIGLIEARGLGWAIWDWEPSWAPWASEVDAFNFRFGPDPAVRHDVPGNAVEAAVTGAWAANALRPSDVADGTVYVPAAANLPGWAGTRWHTDLELKATGDGAAVVAVALLERGRANTAPREVRLTVDAGTAVRFTDVLGSVFGFEGAAALRLAPLAGSFLASSRTSTGDPAAGTYGQYVPAMSVADAARPGEPAELVQLTSPPGHRTNIGLFNPTQSEVDVVVTLHAADGTPLGILRRTLRPLEPVQIDRVFAGAGEPGDCFAVVETDTEGGAVLAYASVVDARTGDAILVPAQKPGGR